jgi:DNA-binding transcriptional regulator GbsR (MarR family)
MSERAQITSIEAVEDFRAQLIVYQTSVRAALEEISSEMLRMRQWIETDRRNYWEQQLKIRARKLEEARQAVFSSRLSNLREVSAAEQLAERKAKYALEEAEAKLRTIKQWEQHFNSRVEPLVKQTDKLLTVLTLDLPKGIAFLSQVVVLLQDYAAMQRGPASAAPISSATSESTLPLSATAEGTTPEAPPLEEKP